jgi:hypothetical protein
VILQDDIIVQPRIYVEGLQPSPISTRFATEDWVNLHFQPIIDENNKLDYSLLSGDVPIGGGGISSIVRPNGTEFTNTDNSVTISYAGTSSNAAGIVWTATSYGLSVTNGNIRIQPASTAEISAKTQGYKPIVPSTINFAVGDALSGTNHIIFTDAGLSAAQETLGIDKKQDLITSSAMLDASYLSGDLPSSMIPVRDVQVRDTGNTWYSCVTNGIAQLPLASSTRTGVVAAHFNMGFDMYGSYLKIKKASDNNILNRGTSTGTNQPYENCPIVPNNLNFAVSATLSDPKHIVFSDEALLVAQETLGIDKKQDLIDEANNLDYSLISGAPVCLTGITLVNGAATVTNHVVTISPATTTKWGLCRPAVAYGTQQDANRLYLVKATDAEIAARTQQYKPIVPNNLNYAVADALSGTNKINFPDNSLSGLKDAIGATGEIPGSGIITLTQGGVTKGTFNVNQSTNQTIEFDAGGGGGTGGVTYDEIYTTDTTLSALHGNSYFWNVGDQDVTLYAENLPNLDYDIPVDVNLSGGTVTLERNHPRRKLHQQLHA